MGVPFSEKGWFADAMAAGGVENRASPDAKAAGRAADTAFSPAKAAVEAKTRFVVPRMARAVTKTPPAAPRTAFAATKSPLSVRHLPLIKQNQRIWPFSSVFTSGFRRDVLRLDFGAAAMPDTGPEDGQQAIGRKISTGPLWYMTVLMVFYPWQSHT
jgi:hypothetical protein